MDHDACILSDPQEGLLGVCTMFAAVAKLCMAYQTAHSVRFLNATGHFSDRALYTSAFPIVTRLRGRWDPNLGVTTCWSMPKALLPSALCA